MPAFALRATADMLKWIFLSFPHYALGLSLFNMNQFKIAAEVCRIHCERLQNTSFTLEFVLDFVIRIPQYIIDIAHLMGVDPILEEIKRYAHLIPTGIILQEMSHYANLTNVDIIPHGIANSSGSIDGNDFPQNMTDLDTIIQELRNYTGLIQIDPTINGSNLNMRVKWNQTLKMSCDPNVMCSKYI